jgi:hypothetical protein
MPDRAYPCQRCLLAADLEPPAASAPVLQTSMMGALLAEMVQGREYPSAEAPWLELAARAAALGRLSAADGRQALLPFSDLFAIVNTQLKPIVAETERNRLLNLLFSPSKPQWDPFCYELDFRRSADKEMVSRALESLESLRRTASVILSGGAASGKTTVLKRVAFELARLDCTVLWAKPYHYGDLDHQLVRVFRALARSTRGRGKPVIIALDDPFALRFPQERLNRLASQHEIPLLMLLTLRTVDWQLNDVTNLFGTERVPCSSIAVGDNLDEAECERLPDYLVTLGLSDGIDNARHAVSQVARRTARDTLAVLYYLLPQTRRRIGESIADEFHRLGDPNFLATVTEEALRHGADVLQEAYRLIAVAEAFEAPVPVEVLVGALGVDYGVWIEATARDGPASRRTLVSTAVITAPSPSRCTHPRMGCPSS